MSKLWIKTPYPYDQPGEGKWVECNTPYERRLWKKHKKVKGMPVAKQEEQPNE